MHALAFERVEIARERGDQRLAFAGFHLGDGALMQHHAADQLHVEVTLPQRTLGRLAHGGEGLNQEIVELGAIGDLGAEFVGARAQGLVRERGDFRLQRIDLRHPRLVALQTAIVGGAEDLFGEASEHSNDPSNDACAPPQCGRLSAEHKKRRPRSPEMRRNPGTFRKDRICEHFSARGIRAGRRLVNAPGFGARRGDCLRVATSRRRRSRSAGSP